MAKFHTPTGMAFAYMGKQLKPEVVKQENGKTRLVFDNVGDDFFEEHKKLVDKGIIVVIEHGDYIPERLVTDEDIEKEWGEPVVVFHSPTGMAFAYAGKPVEPEIIEVDGKKRLQFRVGKSFLNEHIKLVEKGIIVVTSEETYLDESKLDDKEWLSEQVKLGKKPGQIAMMFEHISHQTVAKKIRALNSTEETAG